MSGLPINLDTKILTRQGWKNYQDYVIGELKEGEDIYTYEPLSKTFKWEPLISVISHAEGPMVNVALESTIIRNPGVTLVMGNKVPWIVEVVQRGNRRFTGYDGIKLMELDRIRNGIGEKKRSSDMGTTYYLILGEGDNLVTHQENDSRIDMTNVVVGGGAAQASWTPYNSNETIVVKQNGIVFCVGTLSLRDGLDSSAIPIGNNMALPKALDTYVFAETKAVRLTGFSGFSPVSNVGIASVVITAIPPADEGLLYYQGNPLTTVPITLPLEEARKIIYIPDMLYLGISSIQYDVIDSNGSISTTPGTIDITSANSVVVWQATEATLYEVKLLIEDLPNKVLQANINNLPSNYAREITLGNVDTTLNSFPTKLWDTNVVNLPIDYAKDNTLLGIDTTLNSFPSEVWSSSVVNLPNDYAREATLDVLRGLVEELPLKTLKANVSNLPVDYSTELTLQAISNKLDAILNVLSPSANTILDSNLLSGTGSIPSGYISMSMYVVLGPVVIAGRTYNTGDNVVLSPLGFKTYPSIPYDMGVGSVEFMGII